MTCENTLIFDNFECGLYRIST